MSDPSKVVVISPDGVDLDPAIHGAKAVGLQRLLRAGLAVPPALVVPIGAPIDLDHLTDAIADAGLGERITVRSAGPVSLPGALDTMVDIESAALGTALLAVRASADSARAHATAAALGHAAPQTAVIVQRHVDTIAGPHAGAGAATSRDPVSGAPGAVGSFVWQRNGSALMSGAADAVPLGDLATGLETVHRQLVDDLARLDDDHEAPVEIEFAVEQGRLWYLQLRTFDLVVPMTPPLPAGATIVAVGTPASAGTARGRVHVDVDDALDAVDRGETVVLVRATTSPADVAAMVRSAAVVTERGSRESHAAVVARSLGIPAVVGVEALVIADDHVGFGAHRVPVGAEVIVDGTHGHIARAVNDG